MEYLQIVEEDNQRLRDTIFKVMNILNDSGYCSVDFLSREFGVRVDKE